MVVLALDVGRGGDILGVSEGNDIRWIISPMMIFLSPERDINADQMAERNQLNGGVAWGFLEVGESIRYLG